MKIMKDPIDSLTRLAKTYLALHDGVRLEHGINAAARLARNEMAPTLAKKSRELAEAVAKSDVETSRLLLRLAATAENPSATKDERAIAIAALWPDVQAALDGVAAAKGHRGIANDDMAVKQANPPTPTKRRKSR
jgi:hypothetical protein